MPSNAGFFLWADLSQYLHSQPGDTPLQREQSLNELLFNGGVHLATSEAFSGEDSGWFRITFSVDEKLLKLGLDRYTPFLIHLIKGWSRFLERNVITRVRWTEVRAMTQRPLLNA